MKKQTLGDKLKERRIELKLSQTRAAERMGISTRALCYIETGKSSPSPSVRKSICQVLHVTIEEIVTPTN